MCACRRGRGPAPCDRKSQQGWLRVLSKAEVSLSSPQRPVAVQGQRGASTLSPADGRPRGSMRGCTGVPQPPRSPRPLFQKPHLCHTSVATLSGQEGAGAWEARSWWGRR